MTVLEYLFFVGKLKSVDKKNIKGHVEDILELAQLRNVRSRVIKNLSKGYRQRVGIAQALIGNPDVIILDEPTVGLDPKQIIEIRTLIKNLGKNSTIILSSHILPEISAVCEKVVIINEGEIVAQDTPDNLLKTYDRCCKVKLTVEGNKNDIKNTLSSLKGVSYVEIADRKDGYITSFLIESSDSTDLKRMVSKAVMQSGYLVLELKSLDASLEEIFLQIVVEEKEVNN
jgi:ABC-2 type transport system ATP-binding protein